jgi:2-oxoisovalerate dehydrogenase E1 component
MLSPTLSINPAAIKLPHSLKNKIMSKAYLIRTVEETLLKFYAQGKLSGTIHTCVGQELTGVIVSEFLRSDDAVVSNHRGHGHYLAFTGNTSGLVAEIFGKETGTCGGRGGSQHLGQPGFYTNGILGGMLPISAGIALAKKIKNNHTITVAFIGDGALGEGVVYEVLNLISKWQLPLLIVLENNFYAQSTHQSETLAGSIRARFESFNITSAVENTWEWDKLYVTAGEVINLVRTELKPALLQIDTYRLNAHSKGDDNRSSQEIKHFNNIDSLNVYLTSSQTLDFLEDIQLQVAQVFAEADAASYPTLTIPAPDAVTVDFKRYGGKKEYFSQALNETFHEIMAKHSNVLFIGEDVKSPYGGAFKISQGLSSQFPGQVFNTPISEAAIVGLGCGLALEGFCPFVEIMFGDFIALAFDQLLNHVSKLEYLYNNQVKLPLIIRTPMGGRRGYGATHSQTLDKHLLGIPGLKIIAINNLIHPRCVYLPLVEENPGPVVIIENKILYTQTIRDSAPDGFYFEYYSNPYPVITLNPNADVVNVTIIGYGGMSNILVDVVEDLFNNHDVIAQLICPLQIYPFDISFLNEKLLKNNKIVIVEEGQGFAGFGAEIIAQIMETNVNHAAKFQRIFPPPMPIPASKPLEEAMLPSRNSIVSLIIGDL